jgi:hypothetical protein
MTVRSAEWRGVRAVARRTLTASASAAPAAPRWPSNSRVAKAQVAAKRDEGGEASRLASESIDLADSSENFDRPIVAVEVAAFLEPDAARAALERAIAGALAKGNVVTAAQARAQLEAL